MDLNILVKDLQDQVNAISTYLSDSERPGPSFLPSSDGQWTTPLDSLPHHVEEARKKALALSWSVNRLLSRPSEQLMWTAFQFYETVSLRAIIEKKVPSIIPVCSTGIAVSEISKQTGLPEHYLIQLLRQLTSVSIFREPKPRVFAHTSASALLANAEFSNVVDLIRHYVDEGFKCASYLPEALDLYANKFDTFDRCELRTAFNIAYNTDQHYFEYIYTPENIPKYGERFGRAMLGTQTRAYVGFNLSNTLDIYDWTKFETGDKIVDVGGGLGHAGFAIVGKVKPGVEVIVQDRPSVMDEGRALYGHLLKFQAYDIFQKQPTVNASVYFLRHVLNIWPDGICLTVLSCLHEAMDSKSRLLICDAVWKDDPFWACGISDKKIIEQWSQWKREVGMRHLHMITKLGMIIVAMQNVTY